jgi:soluble lytic murein transglycosylase
VSPRGRKKKERNRKGPPSRPSRAFALAAGVFAAACAAGFVAGRWSGKAPGAGAYLPLIARWCEEYNLNPDLAAAVLEAESGGRPRAVSSSGALGVMQLMPTTAAAMAEELGLPPPGRHDLFDPELNVRLGVYYLSKLRARFGDERAFVIAAYHAGPTRVDAWRRARADLSADEVIAELAFPSTRRYVGRVLANWKRRAAGG